MSSLFNGVYERIASSSLATKLYNEVSSVASSVSSNPITTVGLLGVNFGASALGQITSIITGGYVQLNNFVPQPVRDRLRGLGNRVGAVNVKVASQISRALRINQKFVQGVIVAPIFEELVFRLPLLLASWEIDDLNSEFFSLPLFEGVMDVTGAQITKVALATFLSIAFAYAHGNNLAPRRAAGLFAGGLVLSHLTLRQDGGLGNAMIAHMIHNLPLTLMGAEAGSGILPSHSEEEPMLLPYTCVG